MSPPPPSRSPHGRKARLFIVDASPAVTGGLRGAERMARLLSPWAETTLVLPSPSALTPDQLRAFDHVVRLPLVPLRKSFRALAAYLPALAVAGWRLRMLLARAEADILVLNDFTLMQGAVVRLFGFRGRIVTWVRFDPARLPKLLSRAWLAAGYWASDGIVAVSDFVASKLPSSSKVKRIYDTIDLDLPAARRARAARISGDIVCVGNYIRGKGQDSAINAFKAIAADFPDSRLIFHGGDMGLEKNRVFRRELEREARALADGRIQFREFASDLSKAFGSAVAALNLSESETFSFSCLEASQLGVPVVAYRSGGPEEIIIDGKTGYLCAIGDITAVAQALRLLLGDPAKAAAMGDAAAELVHQRFGRPTYIDATRALFGLEQDNPASA